MTKTIHAQDFFALSSRQINDQGHLVAPGTLARTGVQLYRRMELGFDTNPMGIVVLYRPEREVFDAESMRSFEGAPITIEHPPNGVNSSNEKELSVGKTTGIARDGEMMTGVLTITDPKAIKALADGKNQLSNGYTFELDMTPGITPDGRAYDGVQTKIRGNHVALVDSARCGSACRVADSNPPITIGDSAMSTQKITVDGIPLEVSDTAAACINKLIGQVASLTTQLTAATDAAKGMVSAADHAAVVTARDAALKDVMTPAVRDAMVADWAKLLVDVKRLVPAIVTDGKTCHVLRKEAITTLIGTNDTAKAVATAVLGTAGLDAATEDTVRSTFAAISAAVATPATANDGAADVVVADALSGGQGDGAGKGDPELSGREKAMAASANAWQSK